MSIIRRFFPSRSDQLRQAREEGARQVRGELVSELGYIIGERRLLDNAPCREPSSEKWFAAYELLFPGTDALAFCAEEVEQGLIQLGFPVPAAQALLNQRAQRPEALVVQLLTILAGLPEGAVWGLMRSE